MRLNLANYMRRIGLSVQPKPDLVTLALVMAAHSRAIAFENCDVVLNRRISMARPDVESKLVDKDRGGYCWEQNTLLQMALEEIGYSVTPLMCRVRWGKANDSEEPNTTYTHFALKVDLDTGPYLADVGFSGVNSMAPVALGSEEPQALPEGQFRVVPGTLPGLESFSELQLLVKGDWRGLYAWQNVRAPVVDQECSNWFSCTYPSARFTSQFFACRIIGDKRHHILNNEYVVRSGHGVDKSLTTVTVESKEQLLGLLDGVFGIKLGPEDTDGIDRYLKK